MNKLSVFYFVLFCFVLPDRLFYIDHYKEGFMKKYILIVEDDQHMAEMTVTFLLKEGYAASSVSSGKECLESLRKNKYDLILMDYYLQDMDGLTLIKKIKNSKILQLNQNTPIVVLTAYPEAEEVKQELIKAGVTTYLHKPFGYSELLDIIENTFMIQEIQDHKEQISAKMYSLSGQITDFCDFLPFSVIYYDDQLYCRKWNNVAFQNFKELIEASSIAPLTIAMEKSSKKISSELIKFLNNSEMNTHQFKDFLVLSDKKIYAQFFIQRIPEEHSNYKYVLIIIPIYEFEGNIEPISDLMLLYELLPLAFVHCKILADEIKIIHYNEQAKHFMSIHAQLLDTKNKMNALLKSFYESIEYVRQKGTPVFRKNEKIFSEEERFDLLFIPIGKDFNQCMIVFWPSKQRDLSSSDEREKPVAFPETFLRKFSHNIRTPLNSVLGFSKLVLKNNLDKLDSSTQDDLRTIYKSGDQILFLVDELFDYYRIKYEKMHLTRTILNVNKVLELLVKNYKNFYHTKNEFVLELEELPDIEIDEELFKKICIHLLSNAMKFSKPNFKNHIYIKTFLTADNSIEIIIKDEGLGIEENDLPYIFNPFYYGRPVKEKRVKGLGLGLFIAKHFIEMFNGSIKIESQLNEGTEVRINFPLF